MTPQAFASIARQTFAAPRARCESGDIVSRSTGWGDIRTSYSVYFIQRRDSLTFQQAKDRAESLAYYTDDKKDAELSKARFVQSANADLRARL